MTTANAQKAGPKRYPLTLKKFLLIALPALYHKPKRREAAWREFRKSDWARGTHFSIHGSQWHTVKEFADWLSEGNEIKDAGHYIQLARTIMAWYADWRPAKTSEQNREKALKRHASHKKTGARPNHVALKRKLKELGVID
jgi:hypothetical protein